MSRKRKRKATPNEVWWQQKTRESMQGQLEAFRKKFGRDPRKGEPLIFDPDADEPVPYPAKKMEAELAEAFRKAGTPPQIIYAFKKTGLLIMDGIEYDPGIREEFEAAVHEYFEMERKAKEQQT